MATVTIPAEQMPLLTWADLLAAWEARWPGEALQGALGFAQEESGRAAQLRLRCPLHGGDNQLSLAVGWEGERRGWYQCFSGGCRRHGRMQADTLPERMPAGAPWPDAAGPAQAAGVAAGPADWHCRSEPLRGHAAALEYLRGRGCGAHAADVFGLLRAQCCSGMTPDDGPRLQVALWLDPAHGNQCGWAGRTLVGAEPRWRLTRGARGLVAPRIPEGAPLIAVEGAMDVAALLLLQADGTPGGTTGGTPPAGIFPERLWPIGLATKDPAALEAFACGRRVLVALDADEAGRAETPGVVRAFREAGAAAVDAADAGLLRGAVDWADLWARDYGNGWADRAALLVGGGAARRWPLAFVGEAVSTLHNTCARKYVSGGDES